MKHIFKEKWDDVEISDAEKLKEFLALLLLVGVLAISF